MGSQGVPQTGKIIEVKRRLSGSFFSSSEGLAVLFEVAWLGLVSQERWRSSPTWPKASSNFFVHFVKQNSCQFVCVIMHNFTNLMCIFFAGLTRTATKIGGNLLPHPQTPFMKTELRFHSFLSRHCSFSVPPSLAPKLPMRHDPVDVRNDLRVDGRPPS